MSQDKVSAIAHELADYIHREDLITFCAQTPAHVVFVMQGRSYHAQRFRELTLRPAPTLGRPPCLLRSPVRMPGR